MKAILSIARAYDDGGMPPAEGDLVRMNSEALATAKQQCQVAAQSFMRLQELGHDVPADQLAFNRAVLLALKGLYEAVESSS